MRLNSIYRGGSDMKSTIPTTRTMALIRGKWYIVLQINTAAKYVIVDGDTKGSTQQFHLDSVLTFKDEPLVRLKHLVDSKKMAKEKKFLN